MMRAGDPKPIEGDITNDGFGSNAPLGSGIAILIGAGLGYVALKKKEDEQ
jgi:LPXTG-motif cell wall-anchored protein